MNDAQFAQAHAQVTQAANKASKSGGKKPVAQKKQNSNLTMKISIACLAVVLVAAVVGGVYLYKVAQDDGLIFNNVYAAGVNLGGMTQEEAEKALHEATDETYTQKSMVIALQDRKLELKPADTKAKLDVEALAAAAQNYGRDGNMFARAKAKAAADLTTYEISLENYLTLDTQYISDQLAVLEADLTSELSQPVIEVTGEKPDLEEEYLKIQEELAAAKKEDREPELPKLPEDNMVMKLTVGCAERKLDCDALYKRIINAYNENQFDEISTTYTEELPDAIKLEELFQKYGVKPVDAILNETDYSTTPETPGYGFDLEELQKQLDEAEEGETLTVEFQILVPEVTEMSLTDGLFRDVLAEAHTYVTNNANRTNNLDLACRAIDGLILRPGETFSFNNVVGERTAAKGYKEANVYVGGRTEPQLGGGICQVASSIYYCVLISELEVVQRSEHMYKVDYMPNGVFGTDATVYWGHVDFKFRNNTKYPIRIDANVANGDVNITFVGTETRDYYVEMKQKVLATYSYETVEKEDKTGKYKPGETMVTPYTGYKVETYKYRYDRKTDELIDVTYDRTSSYDKRDKVVCKGSEATNPPPTDPPVTDPPPTDPPITEPPVTDPPPTDPPVTDPPATEDPGTNPQSGEFPWWI